CQPWVVNAFLAGLTVALVYRLGRVLFSPDVGLIAAALTAFSPMALLLNATLMGHTAALFAATLFFYAYWRIQRGRSALRWGVAAGLALGLVVTTRPLTAVGIAAPFIIWSAARVTGAIWQVAEHGTPRTSLRPILTPLLALAGTTLVVSSAIPIYSYAATGDPTKNLYTLVWSYDRVGFGDCCGRSGHTLEKGIRHVRFDLSLMAADLYGWQWQDITGLPAHLDSLFTNGHLGTSITPALQDHLRTESGYWPLTGISWLLLPIGLLAGARRRWTWLLAGAALGLITVHLAYWIGSQRYSTRYYFEVLTALSLISALPLAWLARRVGRWSVYVALAAVLIYSLYVYSTPRIHALYRFNLISPEPIEGVMARRNGDGPVLVIVTGDDVRWRALGTLMSVTSPYLDSDIVVAWDYGQDGIREAIEARFPDRQIIEMQAAGNQWWFADELAAG
ncbi:MAG TPA: glycosyltransferase family 39 protein, partial [Spirillospora sp.]|nr:glycosyltransferase family 39 protein [Spirillospora sp.]